MKREREREKGRNFFFEKNFDKEGMGGDGRRISGN